MWLDAKMARYVAVKQVEANDLSPFVTALYLVMT
jgi:hypothetical protein